jgi:Hg(II)-responsive transcriptional regulator
MKSLTIGQLAKKAQVNIDTVRYYKRKGLIPEPPRRDSGYREYPEDAVSHIEFIKRTKWLGFSLREISDLLSLRVDPQMTCGDVKKKADVKIAEIEGKIRDLQMKKRTLTRLAAACKAENPSTEFPILKVPKPLD